MKCAASNEEMDTPELIVAIAGSAAISAPLGAFLQRRLNSAKAGESEANASLTLTKVADELANQLRALNAEVPGWHAQIQKLTGERGDLREKVEELQEHLEAERIHSDALQSRLEACEDREPLGIDQVRLLRQYAAQIIEDAGAISYAADPEDKAETTVMRRFRSLKQTAALIEAMDVAVP